MKTADTTPLLEAELTRMSREELIEAHSLAKSAARAALTMFYDTGDLAHRRQFRKFRDRMKAISDLLYSSSS